MNENLTEQVTIKLELLDPMLRARIPKIDEKVSAFFDAPEACARLFSDGDIYLQSLFELRRQVDWISYSLIHEKRREYIISPQAHDEIAGDSTAAQWPELRYFSLSLMKLIKPQKKSAVVVSMRDDGISILEWIAHYKAIGFEHVFIYTNDNIDYSDEILFLLSNASVITLIHNFTTGNVSPQRKAFAHSLHFLTELRNYEWVFFADSDEFLVPSQQCNFSINQVIQEINSKFLEAKPSAVCYPWKWFVSDYVMLRSKGLLLERFPYVGESPPLVKSLVRLIDVFSMRLLHFPEVNNGGFFVDPALNVIPESLKDVDAMWHYRSSSFEGGCVNHYWCKSFEEFLLKKRRGDMLTMQEGKNDYIRSFDYFFEWNAPHELSILDVPCNALLQRLRSELGMLLELDGVLTCNAKLLERFKELVGIIAGSSRLVDIYNALASRHAKQILQKGVSRTVSPLKGADDHGGKSNGG